MSGIFSKPKVQKAPAVVEVKQPTVNDETVDRSTADLLRRRQGTAATQTGAADIGTTSGSVAAKSLLGM